jgi:alpha-L-rhamnosidase
VFVSPADAPTGGPSPLLRREFGLAETPTSAVLRVTALGVYEVSINGLRVGDEVLAPGWTSYGNRILFRTFDVTALLRSGPNAIGAILGDGWYRGRLGFHGGRSEIYGNRLALLAELEIINGDRTRQTLVTDESWRSANGPLLASSLYDGETHDARLEPVGWLEPGFDDSAWPNVEPLDHDLDRVVEAHTPPVRRIEELAPVEITTSPSGRTIVDFGQNLVGRLRIEPTGSGGSTITLRHAELLQHGELCTRPLRAAAATDRYTLRGGGRESWEPRFTFHGFRYAEIDGWPGTLDEADVRAIVCHSDMERIGWFECSDPLLNRLHANAVWRSGVCAGTFCRSPPTVHSETSGWAGLAMSRSSRQRPRSFMTCGTSSSPGSPTWPLSRQPPGRLATSFPTSCRCSGTCRSRRLAQPAGVTPR